MYTSYIGQKFLKIYREKLNKPDDYSARQFFEEVQFPLFFRDDSHLMHVGNSPFFQKPKDEDVKKYGSKSLVQLNNLTKKIQSGVPSGAIYVGFAAEEIQATSSGQLTSMNFDIQQNEMYASWIGQALGIGVSGGFVMLLTEDEMLWTIFKGWEYYRKYLSQTPKVKDKQIETWNGQWLCHYLGDLFDENYPMDNFTIETTEVQGNIAIPTQKWSQVVFTLCKKYAAQKVITAYAYNLSQTNTTLGFINIYLSEIQELYELRDKLFFNHEDSLLNDQQIAQLETFYNFKSACKFGTIGLKALEPAKLREYMPRGSADYAQGKEFKFSNKESFLFYQLYKLWIIAMLNKTELLQLASDVAQALIGLETTTRSTTDRLQASKELIESKNVKFFIDGLTKLLETRVVSNPEIFKTVVEQVLKMPSDLFPLFTTLIRFEYHYQKEKK